MEAEQKRLALIINLTLGKIDPMKKLLLTAAFAVLFAAPSFAEDAATPAATGGDAVAATSTMAPAADAVAPATANTAPAVDVAAATAACKTETDEKVKLPENAGDAEKAQWDAALAECLKGKGVDQPAADTTAAAPAADTAAPASTDAAPAAGSTDGEGAADTANDTPAAE